jgi:hypothetical protein
MLIHEVSAEVEAYLAAFWVMETCSVVFNVSEEPAACIFRIDVREFRK